jgi:predicted helicase
MKLAISGAGKGQSAAEASLSQLLIQQYLNQLQDLRKVAGTHREMVVREAFKDLLKGWAREHDLIFVPEYEIAAPTKERRYVDGALLHALRVPFGYWEAKDDKDDLNAEIATKLRRGYPQDNIIFEDSTQAVLIQNKNEVMRCAVDDVTALEQLLKLFFGFARPEVAQFRKAVEQFKTDLPAVLGALRDMIEQAHDTNAEFICFSDVGSRTDYVVLAVDGVADLHFGASVDAYQQVPLLTFSESGEPRDNLTDWALEQFKKHYQPGRGKKERAITKEAIFHYVYGVLHDPVYREKYARNLKRKFPRIPFYPNFWQWADWGKTLMDLHIGYETVEPGPLTRTDLPDEKARQAGMVPKAMLKARQGSRPHYPRQ